MNNKLVSIVCTVKNAQTTIIAMIESVLAQTYQKWELIIIDDGCSDKTMEIVAQYTSKYSQIKSFTAPKYGRGNALNYAIDISQGDYIAILDADDVFHPQKLAFQMELFNKEKDLVFVATEAKIINDLATPSWHSYTTIGNIGEIDTKIHVKNSIIHSSVMLDKKFLVAIGKYDTTRQRQFDYELWLRIFTLGKRMPILQMPLVAKRLHKNQSFENKKRLAYLCSNVSLQLKYLGKCKKYFLMPLALAAFCYGLLPLSLRKKFMKGA